VSDFLFLSSELRGQASDSQASERRWRAELEVVTAEATACRAECETLHQQLEEMGERFADLLDQKAELQVGKTWVLYMDIVSDCFLKM